MGYLYEACDQMLTYDTPALRQIGSKNLTGPKMLPTIWYTYMTLVTKYQISAIKLLRKISWTDGRTEVKHYTPPPPSGSGGGGYKYQITAINSC
jgi:hypothetical protein